MVQPPRSHGHWSRHVGGFTINLQMVYGFFNPLGPVIANARNTMLLGQAPEWDAGRGGDVGAVVLPRCWATGSSSGWR